MNLVLLFCSFLLSISSVVSWNVYKTSHLLAGHLSLTLLLIIVLTVLYAFILKFFYCLFQTVHSKISCNCRLNAFPLFAQTIPSLLFCTGILLLAWLPYMIAYYPGTSFGDTSTQIELFFDYLNGTKDLLDHHPIFDTFVFGSFIWIGQTLFHSANIGCFLFILIQCFLTALAFSMSCIFMKQHGLKNAHCLIALVFFAFYPPIPQYAITMLKDSLYAWIYVFWFLLFLDFVITNGRSLLQKKKLLLLFFLALLSSLTKKTGAYLLVFTCVFLLFLYKKYWKQLVISFLLPAVIVLVLMPLFLFPVISCRPGGKQETLGILFQQTAKYAVDHPEEVTPKEKEAIDPILDYNTLAERYLLTVQDPVKFQNPLYRDYYGIQNIDPNLFKNYLKTWFSQGLKHPDTYLEATLGTCLGYFFPVNTFELFDEPGSGLHNKIIYQPSSLSTVHYYFVKAYSLLTEIPITSLFFQIVIFSWWIPVAVFCWMFSRNKKMLPALIPVFGSIALCILCPCTIGRYVMHLMYTAPLLFWALIYQKHAKAL